MPLILPAFRSAYCAATAFLMEAGTFELHLPYPTPPMWPIGIGTVVVAIVVPFAFFPFSRTLWTAIDLAMRPLEFEEGVAPGFELESEIEVEHHEPAA